MTTEPDLSGWYDNDEPTIEQDVERLRDLLPDPDADPRCCLDCAMGPEAHELLDRLAAAARKGEPGYFNDLLAEVASLTAERDRLREALRWCVTAELDVAGNLSTHISHKSERLAAAENGDRVLRNLSPREDPHKAHGCALYWGDSTECDQQEEE